MPSFEPTTLLTFLFNAPPEARVVELLGSWDNFSHPYRMHHDRRRGKGTWSGCFKFNDIVFDGDHPHWSKPRSGGLKQGGKYWYYYRLNDEVEAYDDSQACTTDCPLLPGQMVNVLEVPVEVVQPLVRSRSASADFAGTLAGPGALQTLEPGDKFLPLNPPALNRGHGRCFSDLALFGRTDGETPTGSLIQAEGSRISSQPPRTKRTCFDHAARRSSGRSWRSLVRPESDYPSPSAAGAAAAQVLSVSLPSLPRPLNLESATPHTNAESTLFNHLEWQLRPEISAETSDKGIYAATLVAQTDYANNEPEIAADEQIQFDFCSPSFSAATVSSAGLDTPLRLSGSYTNGNITSHELELSDVTSRLQAFDAGGQSPAEIVRDQHVEDRALQEYMLPGSLIVDAQSVGKIPLSKPRLALESSLGDDIFSELGYLSGCIT